MSAVTKFANLRSQVKPVSPTLNLYLRTGRALVALRWHSRITTPEYQLLSDRLDEAQWGTHTMEAIQSVRDEIAETAR